MLKELARGSANHKAAHHVGWIRLATFMDPFSVHIKVIFPDQLIRIGQSIFLKIKRAMAHELFSRGATAKQEGEEQGEDEPGLSHSLRCTRSWWEPIGENARM